MIMVALGLVTLALMLWAARGFSRASVATIKAFLAWVAALGGLLLAGMLLLTGRGGVAVTGLLLAGPLVWNWWKEQAAPGAGPGLGRTGARRAGRMSRDEALEVLGLADPVSETDVREAWVRLMRVSHPDGGGTDWLAAQVNQARDVLLGKR